MQWAKSRRIKEAIAGWTGSAIAEGLSFAYRTQVKMALIQDEERSLDGQVLRSRCAAALQIALPINPDRISFTNPDRLSSPSQPRVRSPSQKKSDLTFGCCYPTSPVQQIFPFLLKIADFPIRDRHSVVR